MMLAYFLPAVLVHRDNVVIICKEMTHNWPRLHAKVCGGQFTKYVKFLVKSLPGDSLDTFPKHPVVFHPV
jgi:hypothetical protein